ncbi:hypothetical protein [Halostella litorea]|uniref:hypothetical protein n=1 Tax=Halostella litorea TaxID=2528831 RepID=UPI001092C590|nr:hypothetical protein [Halostella litorea]
MTEAGDAVRGVELSARAYRHLDRASKLLGVGLVAVGLELGGDSLAGVALGAVGAVLALTTVFLRTNE